MEEKRTAGESSQQKIDYTKYPEGFEAILKLMDFIPEEQRLGAMLSLIDNLGRR